MKGHLHMRFSCRTTSVCYFYYNYNKLMIIIKLHATFTVPERTTSDVLARLLFFKNTSTSIIPMITHNVIINKQVPTTNITAVSSPNIIIVSILLLV